MFIKLAYLFFKFPLYNTYKFNEQSVLIKQPISRDLQPNYVMNIQLTIKSKKSNTEGKEMPSPWGIVIEIFPMLGGLSCELKASLPSKQTIILFENVENICCICFLILLLWWWWWCMHVCLWTCTHMHKQHYPYVSVRGQHSWVNSILLSQVLATKLWFSAVFTLPSFWLFSTVFK